MMGQKTQQRMDYYEWRTHVMKEFKIVALKDPSSATDDLFEFDEPLIGERSNLDLSTINFYLHSITNLRGIDYYRLKILYGRQDSNGFQCLEDLSEKDTVKGANLDMFRSFDYMPDYNHIRIEFVDMADQSSFTDIVINLANINANRFIKKHLPMRYEALAED